MAKRKEIPVDMHLPQSKGKSVTQLYQLFRKRAREKSADNREVDAIQPVQMILSFTGVRMNPQMGFVVEAGSFDQIFSQHPGASKKHEVGFTVVVKTILETRHRLYVYKTGKAFMVEEK